MLIYIIEHNGSQVVIYIYLIDAIHIQKLFITCFCLDVPIFMQKRCFQDVIYDVISYFGCLFWYFLSFLISGQKHSSYFTFQVYILHRYSSYLLGPVKLRRRHGLYGNKVLITEVSEFTPDLLWYVRSNLSLL